MFSASSQPPSLVPQIWTTSLTQRLKNTSLTGTGNPSKLSCTFIRQVGARASLINHVASGDAGDAKPGPKTNKERNKNNLWRKLAWVNGKRVHCGADLPLRTGILRTIKIRKSTPQLRVIMATHCVPYRYRMATWLR